VNTVEGSKNRGSRTLPNREYVRRREEGRCFHYGGAYSHGHQCLDKNLRVIIFAKYEGEPRDMKQIELGEIVENQKKNTRIRSINRWTCRFFQLEN